jgi:hypothetical protein
MNKYYIQYHSKTLAALAGRERQQTLPLPGWQFNFPGHSLKTALYDSVKKTTNSNLHTGLNIVTYLSQDSLEKAKEISKNSVEMLLNLISFATLAYCEPSKLATIISIADKEPHPLEHYTYPFAGQELIGSLRIVNESNFRLIFDAYNVSSHQQRVMRALTWLRKGLGEEAAVDEFVSYWVALEVVKCVLRRKLVWKVRNPGEWAGVEDIFVNKLHFQDFRIIKENARNALLHGHRELDNEFIREISGYVQPIRKTLIFCIGTILGLDDDAILVICNKDPRRIGRNPWAILEGDVSGLPTDFEELAKNFPTVDTEIVNKEFSVDQKGELSMAFKVSHRFSAPKSAKLNITACQSWGDRGTGIKQMHITAGPVLK